MVSEPCPFCGCDDETKMEFIDSTTWCFQRCTNCGATGPRVCGGHGGDSRKAWDTRVIAQEEQIAELRAVLAQTEELHRIGLRLAFQEPDKSAQEEQIAALERESDMEKAILQGTRLMRQEEAEAQEEQIERLKAFLREARDEINYWADTAVEHDLVARLDAALEGSKRDGD